MKKENRIQPGILDDLRRQHEFVEKSKDNPEAFSLIVPEAFVQSIRDLGYKSTYTALDELIDNSIQAGAKMVDVFLAYEPSNKSQKKPDYIVVVDDGHGMEPDMIRLAVKWGGTHRHDDREGFGRFGFGLPSSCVSIGRAYTVYSKTPKGDWSSVRVDIDEVARAASAGKPASASGKREEPPAFVRKHLDIGRFESGTLIVIETLDRLERGFKTTGSFVRRMMEHIGVIYRKMIPMIDLRVDGESVQAVDPLFLDPNARWYDDWPIRANAAGAFEFEAKNGKGQKGTIKVRGAWFPFNFHLKDPNGPVTTRNHNDRYSVMKEHHGLIVCRAGRQIDVVVKTPWWVFQNLHRFWKVEIDFDPVLDDLFGITTHKQQVVLSESVESQLEANGIESLLSDLNKQFMTSRAAVKAAFESRKKETRPSEEVMVEIEKKKPRAAVTPPKQAEKAKQNLDLEIKRQAEVTGEAPDAVRDRIQEQTERKRYDIKFEAAPDGPVFRAERLHKQYRVFINTLHRFYSDVFEPAERVPGLRSRIELALFVLAEMELDASEEQERLYKSARIYASQRLTDAMEGLDGRDEREDEVSAEMEQEESQTS